MFIGDEELFRKVLQAYFEKLKWKNAKTLDLLHVMDEVSGRDVTGFILPWI
jgi:aminopeptidase N